MRDFSRPVLFQNWTTHCLNCVVRCLAQTFNGKARGSIAALSFPSARFACGIPPGPGAGKQDLKDGKYMNIS